MVLQVKIIVLAIIAVGCQALNYTELIHEISPSDLEHLLHPNPNETTEAFSGQFEGDIIISDEQLQDLKSMRRMGYNDNKYRWPNGKVQYTFDNKLNNEKKKLVREAMGQIEAKTCVRFVETSPGPGKDYVRIAMDTKGCYATAGRTGGEQILNLSGDKVGEGCLATYIIVHELLHTLGFFHMHSAPNRDEYVKIVWENVENGRSRAFDKHPIDMVNNFEVDYDYESLLHYGENFFAKDPKKPTIIPLKMPSNQKMGQRRSLSYKDIKRVKNMYCR